MKASSVFSFLILLSLFSCSKSKQVQTKSKTVDNLVYSITLKGNGDTENKGHFEFLVEIAPSSDDYAIRSKFVELLTAPNFFDQYYSELSSKAILEVENEEYSPIIYHLERGKEMTGRLTLIYTFEAISADEVTFVFNDEVFNTGKLKYKFKSRA